MARKIADIILRKLLGTLSETLHEAVMDVVSGIIRDILKRLVLALLGAFLAVFGVLFLCLGLVRLLTVFLGEWMAWTIVGLLIMVLGVVILFASMPHRKH